MFSEIEKAIATGRQHNGDRISLVRAGGELRIMKNGLLQTGFRWPASETDDAIDVWRELIFCPVDHN